MLECLAIYSFNKVLYILFAGSLVVLWIDRWFATSVCYSNAVLWRARDDDTMEENRRHHWSTNDRPCRRWCCEVATPQRTLFKMAPNVPLTVPQTLCKFKFHIPHCPCILAPLAVVSNQCVVMTEVVFELEESLNQWLTHNCWNWWHHSIKMIIKICDTTQWICILETPSLQMSATSHLFSNRTAHQSTHLDTAAHEGADQCHVGKHCVIHCQIQCQQKGFQRPWLPTRWSQTWRQTPQLDDDTASANSSCAHATLLAGKTPLDPWLCYKKQPKRSLLIYI